MKTKFTLSLGVTMLFLMARPVLAVTPQIQRERVGLCEKVNQKIDQRIQNYNTRKDNHLDVYQKLHDRLLNLANRIDSEGGTRASQLRIDLATLQEMITKMKGEYADFVSQLEDTKNDDCLAKDGEFRQSLSESRVLLQTFRQQAKAIHTFIKTTIRRDLMNLQQLKNQE